MGSIDLVEMYCESTVMTISAKSAADALDAIKEDALRGAEISTGDDIGATAFFSIKIDKSGKFNRKGRFLRNGAIWIYRLGKAEKYSNVK